MTPHDKREILSKLAGLANELTDYVHHGSNFASNMSLHIPALKDAFVLADTFPTSGVFTNEVAEYPEATDHVKSNHIRLLQGLLSLELSEKQYADIFEKFPNNARKKISRAVEFVGRQLQIFVSHELAYTTDEDHA